MKKLLTFFLLSFVTITFAAGTVANVSWVASDAYLDGTALPATDIDHYTVAWTPKIAGGKISGSLQVKNVVQVAIPGLTCGDFNFTVSATTTATAKYPSATGGTAGPVAYSTGVACTPNPPSGLVVH